MKKRIVTAMIMTVAVCTAGLTAGTTAEAAGVPTSNGSNVYGTYAEAEPSEPVYSVDINWGRMYFTYTADSGTWNPKTHQYEGGQEGTWTAENNTVTVTNHSELPVKVEFGYADHPGYENITGSYSVTSDILESGVGRSYEEADSVATQLTLSGELPKGADKANIGSVNVHLRVVE